MPILPVLDLKQGQVVRGIAGRREEYRPIVSKLTTSSRPLDVARAFREHFRFDELYVADLDAIVARATSKEIDKRPQSVAALSAELRSVGAILDVRSGNPAPGDLLPLEQEGGAAKWWAALAALGALGAAAWYWSRSA